MDDPSNPSIGDGAGVGTDFCYMCGSASCDNLLLACKMCNCRIHVYCYISFCTGASEHIDPDEWVCEYCQPPNFTCSSEPAASKFTEDEAIALRAGSLTLEDRGPPTPPQKTCKKDNIITKETEKNTEDNLHSPSSINPLKPALDHNVEQHVHVEVPFSFADPSPKLQSCKEHTDSRIAVAQGVDLGTNQLKTSTNPVEQSLEDAQVRIDGCLPNPPSQHAAWKGSFTITASWFGVSADSCDKIWGYLPVKTLMKASEFSKEMPNFLQFDAVRRDIIWANMFADGGPDKDDIGLYFLPPDIRSEQCYFCLVSVLEKFDAVIRCHVNGVQLLVFTSKHLDDKSKKINGAYYLWGLFLPPDAAFKEPPQIDVPIPRDSQTSFSSSKIRGKKAMEDTALHDAESQQTLSVQVKVEQLDGDDLAPPPGFAPRPLPAVPPEPELSAPPGFAGVKPRAKYRSIGDLLRNS